MYPSRGAASTIHPSEVLLQVDLCDLRCDGNQLPIPGENFGIVAGDRTVDHALCTYRVDSAGAGRVPLPDAAVDLLASDCFNELNDGEVTEKGHEDARAEEKSVKKIRIERSNKIDLWKDIYRCF